MECFNEKGENLVAASPPYSLEEQERGWIHENDKSDTHADAQEVFTLQET
jgi:hypothetical protein